MELKRENEITIIIIISIKIIINEGI